MPLQIVCALLHHILYLFTKSIIQYDDHHGQNDLFGRTGEVEIVFCEWSSMTNKITEGRKGLFNK